LTCRAWPEASRRLLWVIGGKAHIEHMFSGLPRYQTFDGGAGLYSARNVVERFLTKIKQCRLVATRYDKLAADYLDPAYVDQALAALMSPRPGAAPARNPPPHNPLSREAPR